MEEQEKQVEETQNTTPADENAGEQSAKPEVIEINSKSSIFRYFLGAMLVFGVCFVCCMFFKLCSCKLALLDEACNQP